MTVKSLRAGDLNRVLTVQSNTPSVNAIGESVESWGTFATIWGQFVPRYGREMLVANAEIVAEADAVFRVRYRTDITAQMRVVNDGVTYDIVSVIEYGTRQGLEIVAKGRQL